MIADEKEVETEASLALSIENWFLGIQYFDQSHLKHQS